MSSLPSCDFACFSDEPCHKLTLNRNKSILKFHDDDEKQIYLWRAGGTNATTICNHHKAFYGYYFEKNQKYCCNIFDEHTKKVKG